MIKPGDPRELVLDLLPRSVCLVQVAAVVTDGAGDIISWGWNNSGRNGFGEHAECHAISRANQSRLWYGTVYVASQRQGRKKPTNSKPCVACQRLIRKWKLDVVYRDGKGVWQG